MKLTAHKVKHWERKRNTNQEYVVQSEWSFDYHLCISIYYYYYYYYLVFSLSSSLCPFHFSGKWFCFCPLKQTLHTFILSLFLFLPHSMSFWTYYWTIFHHNKIDQTIDNQNKQIVLFYLRKSMMSLVLRLLYIMWRY